MATVASQGAKKSKKRAAAGTPPDAATSGAAATPRGRSVTTSVEGTSTKKHKKGDKNGEEVGTVAVTRNRSASASPRTTPQTGSVMKEGVVARGQSAPPAERTTVLRNIRKLVDIFADGGSRRKHGSEYYEPLEGVEQTSLVLKVVLEEVDSLLRSPAAAETPATRCISENRVGVPAKVTTATVAGSKVLVLVPSRDRATLSLGAASTRSKARARLKHDVAAILVHYYSENRDRGDLVEEFVDELLAIGALNDTWVMHHATVTVPNLKKAKKVLKDEVSYDTIREEIREVAPEMDALFESMVLDVINKPHLTGRSWCSFARARCSTTTRTT
jgi:hypothetical protein